MPFKNRIRLPFYVTRPQFPTESNTFRLANGSRKTLSSIIRKVFEGKTDDIPKELHERLVIALKHDDVSVEGKYYLGGMSLDGDYEIDWNAFLDFPLAKAAFKVEVTPFDYSNDNCQTCEDLSQVVCEDDDLGTVDEDDTITVHVLDNDNICCRPVTISLVTFNADFLDSCVISGNDIIIHTKPSLPDANSIILATYRAQCPNGAYDEANIIANINGTDPAPICLAPTNPVLVSIDSDTSATFSWTAPSPVPDCGYHWKVTNLGGLIIYNSGDTTNTTVQVTGLTSSSLLYFYVQSNCCSESTNFAGPVAFSLPPPSEEDTCGQYQLYNNDFPTNYAIVTYIDCNGNEQNIHVQGSTSALICALQNSPGDPVSIFSNGSVDINYFGEC